MSKQTHKTIERIKCTDCDNEFDILNAKRDIDLFKEDPIEHADNCPKGYTIYSCVITGNAGN